MKHLSDQELLILLKEDDETAFRDIYERYRKGLYRQAAGKLETTEEVRDMIQEIFLPGKPSVRLFARSAVWSWCWKDIALWISATGKQRPR